MDPFLKKGISPGHRLVVSPVFPRLGPFGDTDEVGQHELPDHAFREEAP
jgi:hypothetical protein